MSDVNKIAAAMAALANALPGSRAYANINLHDCSDETVDLFAALEGAKIATGINEAETHSWRYAEVRVNGVTVVAFGPYHPIAKTDTAAVEAALAQASEALS